MFSHLWFFFYSFWRGYHAGFLRTACHKTKYCYTRTQTNEILHLFSFSLIYQFPYLHIHGMFILTHTFLLILQLKLFFGTPPFFALVCLPSKMYWIDYRFLEA